jgi:hypothetical protein
LEFGVVRLKGFQNHVWEDGKNAGVCLKSSFSFFVFQNEILEKNLCQNAGLNTASACF